jgi:pimeloyl-ACP methyl ester carboxylesterase
MLHKIVFKLTENIFPLQAEKWAFRLFFTPGKPLRIKEEQQFIKEAKKQKILFRSNFKLDDSEDYYIRYSWGEGPAVLLVHGWAERGSQMAHLARPLMKKGFRVVTFDAPAHGNSPGKRTNMLEIAEVIEDIALHIGDFYAIIGHSLGGAAAGYAISQGVMAQKLVTIGSPVSMEWILNDFGQRINAIPGTISRFRAFIERFGGKSIEELSLHHIVPRLRQSGLIVHDKDDREIPYTQALDLFRRWSGSHLLLTGGLGHRRILTDEETINNILTFVVGEQKENQLKYAASY